MMPQLHKIAQTLIDYDFIAISELRDLKGFETCPENPVSGWCRVWLSNK